MATTMSNLIVFCVVVAGFLPQALSSGWRTGRVTNYGEYDGGQYHRGSCGFGSLWGQVHPDQVMAMPDRHTDYHGGACGTCYQVRCKPMSFYDRYGNHYDRNNACYDKKVLTFAVTDECPCDHNHQWCCGDRDHFDLNFQGFQQLAPRHWGVIGIEYRKVHCPQSYRLYGGFFGKGRKLSWSDTMEALDSNDKSTEALDAKELFSKVQSIQGLLKQSS